MIVTFLSAPIACSPVHSILRLRFQLKDVTSCNRRQKSRRGQFICDIPFKFFLKAFFFLVFVFRAEFFVQNKRSVFHKIPPFSVTQLLFASLQSIRNHQNPELRTQSPLLNSEKSSVTVKYRVRTSSAGRPQSAAPR